MIIRFFWLFFKSPGAFSCVKRSVNSVCRECFFVMHYKKGRIRKDKSASVFFKLFTRDWFLIDSQGVFLGVIFFMDDIQKNVAHHSIWHRFQQCSYIFFVHRDPKIWVGLGEVAWCRPCALRDYTFSRLGGCFLIRQPLPPARCAELFFFEK